MDRRNRWRLGSCGLGLALMVAAGSGCRSMRSEVPPRRPFGAQQPPPGVTFSSEPNPNPAGAFAGGQSGGLGPQTGAYSQFPPSYMNNSGGAATPGAGASPGGGFSTGGVEPTNAAPPTGGGYNGPEGNPKPTPNMIGAGASPM